MTKSQAMRMVSFALVAALMLYGLGLFLRDRATTLDSFYSEPDQTIDVFVVGSSMVNAGCYPGVLWAEYGISAHNVFSWAQPMWISYHYILEGLKTQTPKVVVLNLQGMMYGNSNQVPEAIDDVNYKNSFTIDPGINFLQMIGTVDDCGIDLRDPIDFLNLVRFHSRWKYIDESYFTYSAHKQHSYLKGSTILAYQNPVTPAVDAAPELVAPPYETCIEYLNKIVALSEEKGFSLVFTMLPYAYQSNEPAIFRWLAQYAEERQIPFLNYCGEDGARVGFDWQTELNDINHVNFYGALRITRDLGRFLQANYTFTPIGEQSNRAELDVDAARLMRALAINDAFLQGEEGFFRWAASSGGSLAFVNSGAGAAPPAYLAHIFPGLPLLGSGNLPESYIGTYRAGRGAEYAGEAASAQELLVGSGRLSLASGPALGDASVQVHGLELLGDDPGLYAVYYDDALDRVVYVIHFGAEGATFTEISEAA